MRRVTLITGASSGIGAALAHVFAEHGHELVLVARRERELCALADTIAATGRARPTVLPADLEQIDAVERIADALNNAGLEPEIVVNNAGFGLFGPFSSLDRTRQRAMIDLNVRALSELSFAFIDSVFAPSRRHSQCVLDRGLPAGSRHGGLLRHQGLRAVI